MSTLNDDKKPLQGRKNPLKDVLAPKRDQVVSKLADKLREMNTAQRVVEAWLQANSQRQELLERQETYLKDWDEFLVSEADGAFDGSSNLHLPTSFIVCKTYHARFLQALLGVEPPFFARARREDSIDRTAMVTDTLAYTLKDWANHYDGVHEAVDDWIWNWTTTGTGILKIRWEKKYERFLDVVVKARTVEVPQVDPETGMESVTQEVVREEVEERVTKVCFDGPIFEPRPLEDVVLVGDGDPQKADMVIDQCRATASELWTMADQGIFDSDAVEQVINSGPDMTTDTMTGTIKQQRAENAGTSTPDTEADLDRYQILETYARIDVDGSGINTEVVMWIHPKTRALLRATYLRRVNKSGERPFFKSDFYRRPGQLYGIGLLEILHPLSVEMDAMHNMRIDFGLISNMPFGFYKANSSLNPEVISYRPGDLIPLDDPQSDVYFPNLGNRTSFGMQEEMAIQTLVERLTGVNDMMTGAMSGSQGATRTATGVRGLIGESNANLDVHLKRLQRTWRRALRYTLHMLQQRIPVGLSFRVTGEDGNDYWRYVRSQEDIAGDFDIELDANSANSNQSIQQENAQLVFQAVQNPILLQTGIVGQGNIYEATKDFFKSRGIKNFNRYITRPPDYAYMPTPEEEANRILRGIEVPVLPQSDHAGFMEYFQTIFDNDELLGQFNEDQSIALFAQFQRHEKMAAAIAASQAQANNSNQMATNSQTGPLQAAAAGPALMSGGGGDPSGQV